MDEKDLEALIYAEEQVDSILVLSKLAQINIENNEIEKIWDLHLVFNAIKILSEKALHNLRKIE